MVNLRTSQPRHFTTQFANLAPSVITEWLSGTKTCSIPMDSLRPHRKSPILICLSGRTSPKFRLGKGNSIRPTCTALPLITDVSHAPLAEADLA